MRKAVIIAILFCQLVLTGVFAQTNYPIYVTPTLTPPYSLNLSDYSKFGSQKLMVNVTVNDLNISNLPVKLRIKMETAGIVIENPPTINASPIYLDGGSTSILYGKDLLDYFNIKNLVFKGYEKEAYNRTGQLPEGFYKISVQVLHAHTNRLISNTGTTSAWIAVGKPPVLKIPENETDLGQFKGMPITFSWLASNVGSPVSANNIQYKLEMWEMRIDGIAPEVVAASMPVFHEHTTYNTLYSLYPATLMMEPGMKYAWRVTASDIAGFVSFEQKGQSEIRTFVYKALCDTVTDFTASHRARNGLFDWEPQSNHTSYNTEIRNPETGWVSQSQTFENKVEFFDLEYGTTYELRVQAVCNGDPESTSDFTPWKTLSIPEPEPLIDTASCPDCGCDDMIPNVDLENFELNEDLKPGDTIVNKTGTTRFIIKTVEPQGNGVYKGLFLFWAEVWNLKFICEYWDLQVNKENVIVNMDFESVYDPQFLVDIDATTNYLNNLANSVNTLTLDARIKDTLSVNEEITSIYINGGDSVIAVTVDEKGEIHEVVINNNADDIEKTMIKGKNGEEYVVTKDGQVMGVNEYKQTGGGNARKIKEHKEKQETENLSSTKEVAFKASDKQKFGFDLYNEEKSALDTEYPPLKNGYRPAYKSVASFGTDKVGVSENGDNIIFKDEMGIPALKTGEDLTVRGASGGSEVALYAYQKINDTTEKVVGKLNIFSFDEQAKKVYIVPVNGAKLPQESELKKTLNKVYAQAVTSWEVVSVDNLEDVVFENGKMTHGESSAFSTYNKDQKTIVKAFEDKNGKLEKDACYLFFVEDVQYKGRSIAGYMPLQRQVGFIYDNPGNNIVAHELGHGAFNLYHTFSDKRFLAAEHSTQNLMDYKGGTELWKHQWQLVQSPDKLWFSWAQDEKEGESIGINDLICSAKESGVELEGKITCLTPAGIPFTLPDGVTSISFVGINDDIPEGAVTAYFIGKQKYTGIYHRKTKEFHGYSKLINPAEEKINKRYKYTDDKPECVVDNQTATLTDDSDVVLGYIGKCKVELYNIKFKHVKDRLEDGNKTGTGTIDEEKLIFSDEYKSKFGSLKDKAACNIRAKKVFEEKFKPTGFDIKKEVDNEVQKELSNEYINKFAEVLVSAANKYPTAKNDPNLYGDKFYHIINADLLQFENRVENLSLLEHKLQYLKEETGKTIFVIAGYVPFIFDYDNNYSLANDFSTSVYEAASPNLPANFQENTILIVLPFTSVEKYITGVKWQYMMPGIHDASHILKKDFYDGDYKTTYQYIIGAYKWLEKPCRQFVACLNADGTISYDEKDNGNEYGYSYINTVTFYKRPEFDRIRKLNKPDEYIFIASAGGGSTIKNPNYDIEKFEYDIQVINLLEQAKNDPNGWERVTSKIFKEKYITKENVMMFATKQAFVTSGFLEWWNELNIAFGSSDADDPHDNYQDLDKYIYGFSKLSVIDPIIYTIIDLAGLIPIVDNFADVAGLAYSSFRGDIDNITAYSVGLAAVGVGSVVFKYGPELIKVVYKGSVWIFDNSKKFIKVLSKADLYDEAAAGLLKFTDPALLKGKSDLFTKLYKEKKISKDQIKEISKLSDDTDKLKKLDEIIDQTIGSVDEIIASLKNKTPFSGWSTKKWDEFMAGFGNSSQKLHKFDANSGLVDSWDILYRNGRTGSGDLSKALTRNMDAIEALNNLRSNTHRLNLGLTDEILGNIAGHYSPHGYANVLEQLNLLTNFIKKNKGTHLNDFSKIVDQLSKRTTIQKRKGAHGVIKEITENINEYKGKNLTFELDVPNIRQTNRNSKIDIEIGGNRPKYVEVKWMDRKINKDEIIDEFIERDLFNANYLSQISWKQLGNSKLSKSDLINYLSSKKGKDALKPLFNDGKLQSFFPDVKIRNIDDFINKFNDDTLFNSIFK